MAIVDTFWDHKGSSGNALYITTLPSGDVKHVFSKADSTITIPAFPGLEAVDVSTIVKANRDYISWLDAIANRDDIRLSADTYVPAQVRVLSDPDSCSADYEIIEVGKLLDADYQAGRTNRLRMRPHSGGTVSLAGAYSWARVIAQFLRLCTDIDARLPPGAAVPEPPAPPPPPEPPGPGGGGGRGRP